MSPARRASLASRCGAPALRPAPPLLLRALQGTKTAAMVTEATQARRGIRPCPPAAALRRRRRCRHRHAHRRTRRAAPSTAGGQEESGSAVFVSNLQWWTTDAELEQLCAPYGRVTSLRFIDDKVGALCSLGRPVQCNADPYAMQTRAVQCHQWGTGELAAAAAMPLQCLHGQRNARRCAPARPAARRHAASRAAWRLSTLQSQTLRRSA